VDSEKLAEFEKRLRTEKIRLEKELEYIDSTMDLPQSDWSGESRYENHMADLGSSTFSRESDLSLDRNARDLLSKVIAALRRIDEGSFGVCTVCGRPVEAERLEALPYADLCIEDKKKEERSW
jgi:RNA polymerase-binding protein DksA